MNPVFSHWLFCYLCSSPPLHSSSHDLPRPQNWACIEPFLFCSGSSMVNTLPLWVSASSSVKWGEENGGQLTKTNLDIYDFYTNSLALGQSSAQAGQPQLCSGISAWERIEGRQLALPNLPYGGNLVQRKEPYTVNRESWVWFQFYFLVSVISGAVISMGMGLRSLIC